MRARLALALALFACGGAPDGSRPGPAPLVNVAAPHAEDPVIIVLERTRCYGDCPVYRLTITNAGRVEYVGEESVKVKGSAKSSISLAEVRRLVDAFEAADPARLAARLPGSAPHSAEIHLRYRDQPIVYRGERYPDRREAIVYGIADAIDRAVRIERWIGTPSERQALLEAGRL
jgi:hypothetical protein